jgi:hypothetical protein
MIYKIVIAFIVLIFIVMVVVDWRNTTHDMEILCNQADIDCAKMTTEQNQRMITNQLNTKGK